MEKMAILYNDATSPFGRKVVVAAIERQIPLKEVFVAMKDPKVLEPWNPICQIPTLVSPDGTAVFDSDVIIQWLDHQHGGAPLIPTELAIPVSVRMSLANGLMETALKRRGETARTPPQEEALKKFENTIWRILGALEAQANALAFDGELRADQISTAVALGYLDLRFTDSWREKHKSLHRWFEEIGARKSMTLTVPPRSSPLIDDR